MKSTTFFHLIIGALCLLMSLLTIEYHPAGHAAPYRSASCAGGTGFYARSLNRAAELTPEGASSRAQYLSSFAADKANERQDGAGAESAAFFYERDGALLSGEAGSMRRPSRLSINGISRGAAPEMGTGMVNVTAGHAAFRMLPHGMLFEKHIRIVLPYDTSLLPPGFSPYDILTYYYDEMQGRWISIARDSVDTVKGQVISRVDHFTDFVNAVIQTPEMPETHAYVPTTFADMKVADPLDGFRLMEPPSPNNQGTTNLQYPIDIPAGRQGIQPNLALTYNSDGSNGWMGMGWDIPVPAITLDTRWGVPRYDKEVESEIYLLNGEQLATKDADGNYEPLVHRGPWKQRKNGDIRFFPAREGAFQKIIRHGDSPKNYWWEVREKSGLIYYYGKKLGANEFDPEAVLRDPEGNIARWGITEIRDLHDNFVYYVYDVSRHHIDKYMYPKEIIYTGHGTVPGKYKIEFCREPRSHFSVSEVITNCRLGLKEVTSDLLHLIKIYYENTPYKAYFFCYESGMFGKARLLKVGVAAEEQIAKNTYYCFNGDNHKENLVELFRFSYYDIAQEDCFSAPLSLEIEDDDIRGKISRSQVKSKVSDLGGNVSKGKTKGQMKGVGLGPNVFSKKLSRGSNSLHMENTTEGLLKYIDIDGDGLPDKVFNKDGEFYYRKMVRDPSASTGYSFSNRIPMAGIYSFFHDENVSDSRGKETHGALVSSSFSHSGNISSTQIYFSDVDGDGFPDIVENGVVLFNRPDASGNRHFVKITHDTLMTGGNCFTQYYAQDESINTSLYTPGSVIEDCYYDREGFKRCTTHVVKGLNYYLPDHDAVRVWRAPYRGQVTVSGRAFLSEKLSPIRKTNATPDGVIVSIQHNGRIVDSRWIGPDSVYNPQGIVLSVEKDDRIYFRVESGSFRFYDKVYWSPEIRYTAFSEFYEFDANGNRNYVFNASEDFFVGGGNIIEFPYDGEVILENHLSINARLSDVVTISFLKNNTDTWMPSRTFSKLQTHRYNDETRVHVKAGDILKFEISSETNVKWNAIRWNARAYYDVIHSNDMQAYEVEDHMGNLSPTPALSYEIQPFFNMYPRILQAPRCMTTSAGMSVRLYPRLTGSNLGSGSVTLAVKSALRGIVYKSTFAANSLPRYVDVPIITGDRYFVEYYLDDPALASSVTSATCSPEGGRPFEAGLYTVFPNSLSIYGPMYRHWGYFAYSGDTTAGAAIDERLLNMDAAFHNPEIDHSLIDTTDWESVGDQLTDLGSFDIFENAFIPMDADLESYSWKSFGEYTYITADTMANTFPYLSEVFQNVINTFPNVKTGEVARAIDKKTEITSYASSVNVPLFVVNAGFNKTGGSSSVYQDFTDMNGDGYPDQVTNLAVTYSKPQGGLSSKTNGHAATFGGIDIGFFEGKGYGIAGSISPGTGKEKKNSPKMCAVTLSGGASENKHETSYTFMDMNGDGLPDKLHEDGTYILNLGYSFGYFEDTHAGYYPIRRGNGGASNMSFGINLALASICAGYGFVDAHSITEEGYTDINGDGLPDKVSRSRVSFNKGNGFGSAVSLPLGQITGSMHYGASYNTASTYGLPLILTKWIKNPQEQITWGMEKRLFALMDMNGDGLPDIVLEGGGENKLSIRYNQMGKANRLKSVQNFAHGQFTVDYSLSENSTECPKRIWTMSKLTVFDGFSGDGADYTAYDFEYGDPCYERYDREFLGFGTVKTIQREYTTNNVYRTTTEHYHNREHLRKGLKYYEVLSDHRKNKFVEKWYHYRLKEIETGNRIPEERAFCYGAGYTALDEEQVLFYEGASSAQIITRKRYDHGPYGNIKTYYQDGDIQDGSDDFRIDFTYYDDPKKLYLTGIPVTVEVGGTNSLLRYRKNRIDPQTGKITETELAFEAVYHFSYDMYGNISERTMPENHQGKRMHYEYLYDTATRTHVVNIRNSRNEVSAFVYDYYWGKPLAVTDINGNTISYSYDGWGRTTRVKGPKESDYTLRFRYGTGYRNVIYPSLPERDRYAVWSVSEHYDAEHPGNPITVAVFADGWGKTVQTQRDIELNGTEYSVASGRNVYDAFGRVTEIYDPEVGPAVNGVPVMNRTTGNVPPTVITYDILDRRTTGVSPDGSVTHTSYGFGKDRTGIARFRTETVNPNGHVYLDYTDPRGLTVQTTAPLNTQTFYSYNPLGELIASYDPEGHMTRYFYDLLGRCYQREHPASGIEGWTYDPAGNLIERTTSNLIIRRMRIKYEYEYDRITAVLYPDNPSHNRYYLYGTSSASNSIGRVQEVRDGSGISHFSYGPLGEVKENMRTFVVPFEKNTFSFTMRYEYDSWNRIRKIIYPDGEQVNYSYDRGGNLQKMEGQKERNIHPCIDHIEYDKFGRRQAIRYGNGDQTVYRYDIMHRLEELNGRSGAGDLLQELRYDYDPAGNMTAISNTAQPARGLGGTFSHLFSYDELDRLVYGQGLAQGNRDGDYSYRLEMQYHPSGKILSKYRFADRLTENGREKKEDYYRYEYNPTDQPHMVQRITKATGEDHFLWDYNGNMVLHIGEGGSEIRYHFWDEENRMQGFRNTERASYYRYDETGERYLKMAGKISQMNINGRRYGSVWFDYPVLYVNPFVVCTGKGYTKHYYAGQDRIASRIGGGGLQKLDVYYEDMEEQIVQAEVCAQQFCREALGAESWEFMGQLSDLMKYMDKQHDEREAYFYHNDHLGSSSWITDQDGNPVQHLQYQPFGESWIDQRNSSWNSTYTFSGKERDNESGYAYFGARYYNSDLSIWLSPDPLAELYPALSPYAYCANNPLKFIDPNGMELEDPPKVINNTNDAIKHYKEGNGESVEISQTITKSLLSSDRFTEKNNKIINGETTSLEGDFNVDLTNEKNNKNGTDSYFVGRTNVKYNIDISEDGKDCMVTYTLFDNDGFWDPNVVGEKLGQMPVFRNINRLQPDGKGPNLESKGKPYDFIPQTLKIAFPNPGYKK